MAITLTLLSTSRMAGGVLFLLAPKIAAANFSLSYGPSSKVLTHLVGARDLIIGALLFTAHQEKDKPNGTREVKRALLAGLAMDAAEVITNLICYSSGELSAEPLTMLGGGAVVSFGLGLYNYLTLP
ncbi:DUF4267 domain-containing protein [Aspergillus affinis]|uniref:DUF4267 domain-containing protein n=1 Tax=Aspergillus affinis TaxID=1070780 RepID=UPI0022FEE2FB|nr:uncharacterized protein KD926_010186 [Aspergillus affinis]KAI9038853.1 hypothetical protein KD926_010186 [Aspergillus affinis]